MMGLVRNAEQTDERELEHAGSLRSATFTPGGSPPTFG